MRLQKMYLQYNGSKSKLGLIDEIAREYSHGRHKIYGAYPDMCIHCVVMPCVIYFSSFAPAFRVFVAYKSLVFLLTSEMV